MTVICHDPLHFPFLSSLVRLLSPVSTTRNDKKRNQNASSRNVASRDRAFYDIRYIVSLYNTGADRYLAIHAYRKQRTCAPITNLRRSRNSYNELNVHKTLRRPDAAVTEMEKKKKKSLARCAAADKRRSYPASRWRPAGPPITESNS